MIVGCLIYVSQQKCTFNVHEKWIYYFLTLKSLSFTYLEINVLKIEVTMTCIGLSMVFYGLYQLWLNKINIFHLL